MRYFILTLAFAWLGVDAITAQDSAKDQKLAGQWMVQLDINGKRLPFRLHLMAESQPAELHSALIINGAERIAIPKLIHRDNQLIVDIEHYDSRIVFDIPLGDFNEIKGAFSKTRGKDNVAKMEAKATRYKPIEYDDPKSVVGRWSVNFESDDDPAVAIFEKLPERNEVQGTFLTTTGDYRYLAGGVQDGQLTLSCFDGAHAFLFTATVNDEGRLDGVFHSGNWWQTNWSADRDDTASLPDAFKQTVWTDKMQLGEFQFPGLDGKPVSLNDDQFAGKCRIIEVFGSWCPNCHDAGEYLSLLQKQYGSEGLSILGLAFELTGDFDRDVQQVHRYVKRTGAEYPILIAGTSDKALASEVFPVLDKVRSYPTFIFLDRENNVQAIYTGFSGPATGDANKKLKQQFEAIIKRCLDD